LFKLFLGRQGNHKSRHSANSLLYYHIPYSLTVGKFGDQSCATLDLEKVYIQTWCTKSCLMPTVHRNSHLDPIRMVHCLTQKGYGRTKMRHSLDRDQS